MTRRRARPMSPPSSASRPARPASQCDGQQHGGLEGAGRLPLLGRRILLQQFKSASRMPRGDLLKQHTAENQFHGMLWLVSRGGRKGGHQTVLRGLRAPHVSRQPLHASARVRPLAKLKHPPRPPACAPQSEHGRHQCWVGARLWHVRIDRLNLLPLRQCWLQQHRVHDKAHRLGVPGQHLPAKCHGLVGRFVTRSLQQLVRRLRLPPRPHAATTRAPLRAPAPSPNRAGACALPAGLSRLRPIPGRLGTLLGAPASASRGDTPNLPPTHTHTGSQHGEPQHQRHNGAGRLQLCGCGVPLQQLYSNRDCVRRRHLRAPPEHQRRVILHRLVGGGLGRRGFGGLRWSRGRAVARGRGSWEAA
jgi:hypothetical protein